MKKLLLLLCFLFLFFASNAQYPVTQFIGADSTLVKSRGGLQGRFAPIPFTDTAQANTSRIRQYPGALIYTSGVDKYWYRNSTMTGWVEFTSSGGATTNIYNSDGVLTGNRQLQGGEAYNLNFDGLGLFGVTASLIDLTSGGTTVGIGDSLVVDNTLGLSIRHLSSDNDTSTYKPLGYDPITGKVVTRSSWIGGGGGSGLPTKFDSSYTPLGGNRGSEYIVKSVRIRRNNITVNPTQIGDSAMYWNIDVPDSSTFATIYRTDTMAANIRGEISSLPTPTLQQVLTEGSILSGDNSIIATDSYKDELLFGNAQYFDQIGFYARRYLSFFTANSPIQDTASFIDLYQDSIHIKPWKGGLYIDSLNSGSATDSVLVWDASTGLVKIRNASAFSGGGGGVTTIGTINGTTKSANGGVISGSTLYLQTVDATYPGLMTSAQKARLDSNSYLTIDKTYDSLAWRRNDSTFLTKSLRIQLNGSTVTPTTTDSTLSYNIVVSGGSGTVTSVATNTSTGIIGGTITNTGTISADTTLLSTRLWRQKGVDSVQANVNLKLNISDTSAMLTNYLRGSGTSLQLALFDGTRSIKGMSQYTYANSTTYPELYIGTTGTTASSIKFRNLGGTTEQINNDGGYWGFYGSSTYKNIQFYSHTGGSQIMRLYRPTTYNLIDLKGVVTASDLTVLSNYKGNFDIERTVPYANNNNYHGYTDQTIFNAQSSAFNSFGTFVTFGNDRFNQDHYAGFQTVWYKDSTNKIGKVYDFVSAVSEMRAGTIDTLYRFKVFEATKTGGTIVKQYGIQIDNLSNATTNVGAWIYNNVGIGPTAHTPSERLTVDGNILGTGTIKTADPGSGAGAWKLGTAVSSSGLTLNTTQYIEISIGGTIYKLAVVDPPTPIP